MPMPAPRPMHGEPATNPTADTGRTVIDAATGAVLFATNCPQ
jgi:hypothetical protein